MNIFMIIPRGMTVIGWILLVLFFASIIRIILTFFKTLAVLQGEANYIDDFTGTYEEFGDRSFRDIFYDILFTRMKNLHMDDYYLPLILGIFELSIYPILISIHKMQFIGFWIIVKTTGQWRMWGKSRTAFNRYLFGNILALSFSYLLYLIFFRT